MSVVVWDGKTLAADKQGTMGMLKFKTTKIRKLPNGTLLAWVGGQETGQTLANWYADGAKVKDWPGCQKTEDWARLIVVKAGEVWEYERLPIAQKVETIPMAWGSGSDFALGAIALGAGSVQAVKVASKYCTTCGLGVDSFVVTP